MITVDQTGSQLSDHQTAKVSVKTLSYLNDFDKSIHHRRKSDF